MSDNKITEGMMQKLTLITQAIAGVLGEGKGPDHVSIDQFNDHEIDVSARRTLVIKSEAECLVTGVVLEPEVVDSQGDIYSEEEIFKGMESFNLHCRRTALQHSVESGAHVVESWTTKNDQEIGGQPIIKGTWLMTTRLPPEEYAMVQKGIFTGYSVCCRANTVAKSDKPLRRLANFDFSHSGGEVSLVDKAANRRTILLTKAEDTDKYVEIEKNLAQILEFINAANQQTAEEEEENPLKAILDNLQAASESLSNVLELGGGPLQTSTIEDPVSTITNNTEYTLEKNLMPLTLEDIKKSLETAEGQEVLSVLIEKATKSLVDENTTLKAGLEVINKREEERSEEILKSAVNSYSGLGLDEEKDLALFKAVAKTGPKHFARFKEVLELAKSSLENADLLSPEGNDDNTETLAKEDADSGLPKEIQCKVEEFQKADGSLTFPQAVAKALGRGE